MCIPASAPKSTWTCTARASKATWIPSPAPPAPLSLLPPENATGNFVKVVQRIPVKILVSHEGVVLRPGMNVNVTIYTK
jgi:multidrug resistance efflux pump